MIVNLAKKFLLVLLNHGCGVVPAGTVVAAVDAVVEVVAPVAAACVLAADIASVVDPSMAKLEEASFIAPSVKPVAGVAGVGDLKMI